jgi:hypothetical protein
MDNHAAWFQYARSQGIQQSMHRKFVLKHVLAPDQESCEWTEADADTIVYSGMYIVVHDDKDIPLIRRVLSSPELCRYLTLHGKDMAGGYKTFNTKLVKQFKIPDTLEEQHE